MFPLYKKEFLAYINSSIAYIIIGIFLLVLSLMLWVFPDTSLLAYGYASLDSLFNITPYLFMFLIPAITMRTIAEELKEGTFEILLTKPVSHWQIVLSKYFASVTLILFSLLPTIIYYLSLYNLGVTKGNIDSGAVIGSYIGLFLLGSLFASIGIYTSSLSNNQIIALAIAIFLCFFFYSGFDSLSKLYVFASIESLVINLGISAHYQAISRGVLDTRDLVYFISCIAIFLYLTHFNLIAKK